MSGRRWLMLPVVSLSAECLVMGYLMRRNILAYKAPSHNEGYDIICIHPDPKRVGRQVRVQVKSRYQTDCNRAFFLKARTFGAFDYLIVVFLNIGYFYSKAGQPGGAREPELYVLPHDLVRAHLRKVPSGLDRVMTRNLHLESYKNEKGFELIAGDLGVEYPSRAAT